KRPAASAAVLLTRLPTMTGQVVRSSLPPSRFSRPSASTAGFAALEVLQQLAGAWDSFVIVGCLSFDVFVRLDDACGVTAWRRCGSRAVGGCCRRRRRWRTPSPRLRAWG